MVSTVLSKRGHDVRICTSVADALNKALESLPEVLITEAVLPAGSAEGGAAGEGGDGAELVEALRRKSGLQETAVLVLTTLPEHDERVRTIRGDGYLGKPFRFVDLDRAVERSIQAHKRRLAAQLEPEPVADNPMGSGIHGTLDQLGLGSLLTMIEMEGKSGILLLRRGSQSARLYCKEGRVLAARLFGGASPTHPSSGTEAVYKLLSWTDGHFNFTAMPVSVPDEIGLRTALLLLEGARRSDEAQAPSG